MPRARNIKPSFFKNDLLSDQDPLGRLLFIGMWTICDYRGCLEWRPKRVKAEILPYDECDVESLAINLDKSGFIRFYSDGEKMFAKVVNFTTHQNPHKNERQSGSDIPDYTDKMRQVVDLKGLTIIPYKSGSIAEENPSDPADPCSLNPDPCSLNPEKEGEPESPEDEDKGPEKPKGAVTINTWLKYIKAVGEKPIPPDDSLFEYVDNAGIPHDWIRACWIEFKAEFSEKDRRQKDWRAHFRNFVRKNYYKLWWVDAGEYKLTSRGQQAMMAIRGSETNAN